MVDFIILGAQKAGTTTLFQILDQHPHLSGCTEKEPHFFSKTANWRRELPQYESLYIQEEGLRYFEASTSYTNYPLENLKIWEDLYTYNPDMKFIYIVRNPIDRIRSAYTHYFQRGFTSESSIDKEIVKDPAYLAISRYYSQITPYLETFGQDSVFFIDFDDLLKNRKQVIYELSDFLDLDFNLFGDFENVHANKSIGGYKSDHRFDNPPFPLNLIKKISPKAWQVLTFNRKSYFMKEKPQISPAYQEMILTILSDEIREMEKLMNRDFSKWRRVKGNSQRKRTGGEG